METVVTGKAREAFDQELSDLGVSNQALASIKGVHVRLMKVDPADTDLNETIAEETTEDISGAMQIALQYAQRILTGDGNVITIAVLLTSDVEVDPDSVFAPTAYAIPQIEPAKP